MHGHLSGTKYAVTSGSCVVPNLHKQFMGENRVILVLEEGELLVFGYEISILVTMDVFVQLTRPKESMLGLLDP